MCACAWGVVEDFWGSRAREGHWGHARAVVLEVDARVQVLSPARMALGADEAVAEGFGCQKPPLSIPPVNGLSGPMNAPAGTSVASDGALTSDALPKVRTSGSRA